MATVPAVVPRPKMKVAIRAVTRVGKVLATEKRSLTAIITRVNTVQIQRFGRASYISWTVMPGFQGLGFAFFSFFISPPQLSFSLSQKLRYSMMTTVTKRTIRIIPTLL